MVDIRQIPVSVETRGEADTTNAYLIGDKDAILVDPAGRADALDEAIGDRTIRHIAVTHTHPDHVGGVKHYAAQTGATVWCRTGYVSRFREAAGVSPDQTFREGTNLSGSGEVYVMDTPGHAPDHVGFIVSEGVEDTTDVLVGDLLIATGSIFVGPPDGDMRSYMVSLRRLLHRGGDSLYPGHGPPIDDPRRRIKALLAHRRERERRIQRAVERGASSIEEIIEDAYEKDLSGVEDLAAATVKAHLSKLSREGRVRTNISP